jgi:pimeloyl-ACP methyl ester carboxylesterase
MVKFAERNEWPQDYDAFRRQSRAASEHTRPAGFENVDVPGLVIAGREDLVNPPATAERLASAFRDASLVLLDGVGHLPHIEAGQPFRAAIERFLYGLPNS